MQPFTCGGDVRVAAHLSTILADAPKDRSADFLAEAKDHPDLADFALRMANTPAEVVLSSMRDSALPLPCRAIAARFASGLESCGEASKDHLNALLASFREISVPEDLVAATSIAAARTREPITVMVPLIWLAAQASKETRVCDSPVPPLVQAGGVPLYALDEHTRLGREAIWRFACDNVAVRSCLQRFVAAGQSRHAAYVAAYYVDAAPVVPREISSRSSSRSVTGTLRRGAGAIPPLTVKTR